MYKVGTVCMKIAGRDAAKTCVIVEDLGKGLVLIEGDVRRRKCNVLHLEPLGRDVKVKQGASHAEVMKALGLTEREAKTRKPAAKPKATRSVKKAPVEAPKKKAKKKEA